MRLPFDGELSDEYDGVVYAQPHSFQSRAMNMGKTDLYGLEPDYDWLITSRDRLNGYFETSGSSIGYNLTERFSFEATYNALGIELTETIEHLEQGADRTTCNPDRD